MTKTMKTPKGTELPMLDLRGKPYLQVAHRIVWFREEHPTWTIETVAEEVAAASARYRAYIKDDTGKIIATATKVETKQGFADFVEKAETGSVGRALALCGYGTQFAPELDEEDRLADAPVKPAKKLVCVRCKKNGETVEITSRQARESKDISNLELCEPCLEAWHEHQSASQ